MKSRDASANGVLFGSDLWRAALEKYADATHLTVILFDADARAVFGPVHPTPLFQLFDEAGYDPGIFAECARRCIAQTKKRPPVLIAQFHGLAVVGASLGLEGKIVGAAVGGYAFADFSQVSEIQRLAKQSGIVFERVWEIARKQSPIPQQRLIVHGELLQVLGDALLRENYRTRQYEQAAAIINSSDDAIISQDCNGVITSWNNGAGRLYSYPAQEAIGQPITMLIPPDRQQEEKDMLARIMRGECIEHVETVRVRKDGSPLQISLTISPIKDSAGHVIGASKIARDITERKRAQTTQQMLLNELNHRVKNTLAIVQAIAQQTLARTRDPADFVASFGGRIQSLARVHSLLSNTTWQRADLRDLIRDQVLLGPVDKTRLTAWGPTVRIEPQMALHLALMLHELGTNACKYGALSVAGGWVTVNWTMDDALHIRWVERGGPPVVATSKRGFGSTLIDQSAKGQGGDAQMLCEAEGVTWTINLPLPDRADSSILPQIFVQPSSAPEAPVAGASARTSLAGRRFLVVEDETMIGLDLVAGLEDAEAQVEGPIGTAKQAIEAIERASFDGALLDANLHGYPVDEIASALTRRGVPFVFVTGHGPEGLPETFRGVAILGKPCSRQQVLDAATQLIARKRDVVRLRR
jgi:PAS domain S-box-containing protein